MTKVISVTNEKGGCGKTTTAVNLASILTERGKSVLLIDADYQSYTTLYFDLYDPDKPSLFHVLFRGTPMGEAISETKFGVKVLRSSSMLKGAEDELTAMKVNKVGYTNLLKDAMAKEKEKYDFVIIDCPPQSYRLLEVIQSCTDYLILPMIPDEFAIHSLKLKAGDLIQTRKTLNPRLQILGGLIVMSEMGLTKTAYKKALQEQSLIPVFKTVIRKNVTLSRAINAHEPINFYDRSSNGNKDYQALATEILGRIEK